MWPASARSARLPDHRAPATSPIRHPHVRAKVAVSRPREREAAVDRCESPSIERIVAGSAPEPLMQVVRAAGRRGAGSPPAEACFRPIDFNARAAVADHPQGPLGAFWMTV